MDEKAAKEKVGEDFKRRLRKRLGQERRNFEVQLEKAQQLYRREIEGKANPVATSTHIADCHSDDEEVLVKRMNNLKKCLEKCDQALKRIDAGIYGKCQDCGEAIPIKRLEAIPFADRCTHCKNETEGIFS